MSFLLFANQNQAELLPILGPFFESSPSNKISFNPSNQDVLVMNSAKKVDLMLILIDFGRNQLFWPGGSSQV